MQATFEERVNERNAECFTQLKQELAGPRRLHAFNLTHSMNITPRNLFAFVKATPFTLCGVMAYIQHIAFDLTHKHGYALEESEIIEIVGKFYFDVTLLDDEPLGTYHEIDLFENWESYAGFPLEERMPELHRDGLLAYIQEMAIRNKWGSGTHE